MTVPRNIELDIAIKFGRLLAGPGAIKQRLRSLSPVTFSKLGNWGRFGNQLFQISAVLGYAARYGCRPLLPVWRCDRGGFDYGHFFPQFNRYSGWWRGPVYSEPSFAYGEIPFIPGVDLRGNYQSEKYFAPIKDKIRALFAEPAFATPLLDSYCAEHGLGEFNALHIRFYKDPLDATLRVVDAVPDSYFLAAVKHLGTEKPLVVATDNKVELRAFTERHGITQNIHLLTFDHPLLDFFMLARADRIAISNSSFSWWAAYLGRPKSEILAPHRYYWFNEEARRNPFWTPRDLYPDNFKELIL